MPASWQLSLTHDLQRGHRYTFYVPSAGVLALLKPGDLVRLRFAFARRTAADPEAERMWIEIATRSGHECTGYLTNKPLYIEDLHIGDLVSFTTGHIISTEHPDPDDPVERYFDRCLVSRQVLHDQQRIGYFYREESLGEQDGYRDSGWRILSGLEPQDYLDDPANSQFVALGTVLNVDDSIVTYLDEPVGSAFEWDEAAGHFVAAEA